MLFFLIVFSNGQLEPSQKFPEWVRQAAMEAQTEKLPGDADLWRLLDETTITLRKDGRQERRRRMVQWVLRESGADQAGHFLIDGDENATKIKKLKGWHQRASGKFDKLDKDDVVTYGQSDRNAISTDTATLAQFDYIGKGSIVAFESLEHRESYFPMDTLWITAPFPIMRRKIHLTREDGSEGKDKPFIHTLEFDSWDLNYDNDGGVLEIRNIPGIEDEMLAPDFPDPYPRVVVGFNRETIETGRFASWDNMAKWYHQLFNAKALGSQSPPTEAAESVTELQAAADYFRDRISYRQQYLTAARGWEPEAGEEVARLAFGDCKDMVSCLSKRLQSKKIKVYPTLANIGDGPRTTLENSPGPEFNHLIAAIPLAKSLGLASEVTSGEQRFLIYDPTAKFTDLGYLPSGYRGRHIMICTEAGAHWVAIPETALEKASVTLTLNGMLDEQFTFLGSIKIEEAGDAYSLRTSSQSGNPRDLEWMIRSYFDIPGVVDLEGMAPSLDKNRRLTLIYQVIWPSFMMRDAGGLRLPFAISGYYKRGLTKGEKPRLSPIVLEDRPQVTWNLAIRTTLALNPGLESSQWEDNHNRFSWKAGGGSMLEVTFSQERNQAYFPRNKIEEGITYWENYREAFNKFRSSATLFFLQ